MATYITNTGISNPGSNSTNYESPYELCKYGDHDWRQGATVKDWVACFKCGLLGMDKSYNKKLWKSQDNLKRVKTQEGTLKADQ